MGNLDVWSAHVEWIRSLSAFLGCPLRLVEGSETVEADVAAATLQGVVGRLDTCDGEWCGVSASGTQGWISRHAVWGVD